MENKLPSIIDFAEGEVVEIQDDNRGNLVVHEIAKVIPFQVKRVFFVYLNKSGLIRGNHGHRECWQVLVALDGQIEVTGVNQHSQNTWNLSNPKNLLLVPPMNIIRYKSLSGSSILGVYCSEHFNQDDYIY